MHIIMMLISHCMSYGLEAYVISVQASTFQMCACIDNDNKPKFEASYLRRDGVLWGNTADYRITSILKDHAIALWKRRAINND